MSTTDFAPAYLARAAEQLGWDDTPAGQAKRREDLALLQELEIAQGDIALRAPLTKPVKRQIKIPQTGDVLHSTWMTP